MVINKLLCIVVLCAIYEGASKDVVGGRCIQNRLNGFCAPYATCQAAQLQYSVGGQVSFCNVRGEINIVCCFDRLFNLIPLTPTFFDLLKYYGSVIPTDTSRLNITPPKPTTSTSTTRDWRQTTSTTSTIRPWWATTTTTSTVRPWWATTTTTARPVATTQRPRTTTTEYTPPIYDYGTNQPLNDGCADIDPKLTAEKTGRRAWDKCVEYQHQLVYPCQESVALLRNLVRVDNCARARLSKDAVARPEEFKHMVVLAVSTPRERLQWACTGTLISDRFILSSAHCWTNRSQTEERHAILGLLEHMTGNKEAYQEHRIESIIYRQGPNDRYHSNHNYHDIALLKTATPIRLNQWIVPACLDVSGGNHVEAVATRWRRRSLDITNRIQKGYLHQLTQSQYEKWLHTSNNSKRKYQVAAQMGYASYGYSTDNCEYDNEGPLTIDHPRIHCMYTVIGVSSEVGATCGSSPASSYTKVSNYVPWIEDIVWPEDKFVFRSK